MNIEEFCKKANEHKILKNKYLYITPKFLTDIKFPIKKYYGESDFFNLNSTLQNKPIFKTKKELDKVLTPREKKAKDSLLKSLVPHIYSYKNITNRKGDSLVSMYILIPSIEKWINQIREKYGIDPNTFRKKILYKFEEQDRRHILNIISGRSEKSNRRFLAYRALIDLGEYSEKEKEEKIKEYKKKLKDIENKEATAKKLVQSYFKENKLSDFKIDVSAFCLSILKLPSEYYGYFRNFILFDEIDILDDPAKNGLYKSPEIEFITEPSHARYYYAQEDIENFEPHIKIKIYGNTTKEQAKKAIDALYNEDFIMKLPAYNCQKSLSKINRSKPFSLYKKVVTLFLIEKEKLTHTEASNVLRSININIKEGTISRDIKRLREALKV